MAKGKKSKQTRGPVDPGHNPKNGYPSRAPAGPVRIRNSPRGR